MPVAVEFSTIAEMFDAVMKRFAADRRPMLMHKVEKQYLPISFTEYRRNVERFALGLASFGIAKHDRVAIIAENRPEWIIA
ncbi:MAG: AMP-binding protein, partial [Bacteroidota bacterium]